MRSPCPKHPGEDARSCRWCEARAERMSTERLESGQEVLVFGRVRDELDFVDEERW